VERLNGRADAVKTPIGHLPTRDALDSDGLDLADADLDTLLSVDPEVWKQEAALVPEHFEKFGDHLPQRRWDECRVGRIPSAGVLRRPLEPK
jgi:phosphoenolpyruvate carboxykinase (GTP)